MTTDPVEYDLPASQETGGEKQRQRWRCEGLLGEVFRLLNKEMLNCSSLVLRKPSWNTTPSTKLCGPLTPWKNLLRCVLLFSKHLMSSWEYLKNLTDEITLFSRPRWRKWTWARFFKRSQRWLWSCLNMWWRYVNPPTPPTRSDGGGDCDCPCFQDIPLLQRGNAASITLSQVQISCLLANAFYCTFPHRNATRSRSRYHNYPTINFSRWEQPHHDAFRFWTPHHWNIWKLTPSMRRLFGDCSMQKIEKLKAIMHYFQVVTNDSELAPNLFYQNISDNLKNLPRCCFSWQLCLTKRLQIFVGIKLDGLVTFERRCLVDTNVQSWKRW